MECQSALFSLPKDIHYLNCATLGPLNIHAERAGQEALLLGRNPVLRNRDHFFDPVQNTKVLFGQLVNANPTNIAIIPSASYGLASVANNITLNKWDEVIILEDQFPSNYYIWKHKCDVSGAVLRTIKAPDSNSKSKDWTTEIIKAISGRTKVVAMAHVHWMDGTYFDLESIGQKCRTYGAYLVIDGTQSVGALPFDIQKIQPDALITASYKWLLSAYGLGFAYFGDRLLDGQPLEMNWINKADSYQFENLTEYRHEYQPGAARYSMGEQSNFISIAMANASLELLNQWKPENIQSYAKSLSEDAWQLLQSKGIIIDTSKPSHHMTGLRFDDHWNMDLLQEQLKQKNIIISRRGTALRISINVYNQKEDIDALVSTILAHQ